MTSNKSTAFLIEQQSILSYKPTVHLFIPCTKLQFAFPLTKLAYKNRITRRDVILGDAAQASPESILDMADTRYTDRVPNL